MPALDTRPEELATAQGIESTVAVYSDKVVVKSRSMSGILRRALSAVTDPMNLIEAIQGPNKEILLRALVDSSDLAQAILGSMMKRPGGDPLVTQPAPAAGSSEQIVDKLRYALENNRSAFMGALQDNQELIKEWAGDHRDLMGIFLKGDVHVAIDSIYSVELTTRRDNAGVLKLDFGNEQLSVQFPSTKLESFEEAKRFIDQLIGAAPAPAATVAESPVAANKACPMCAEDVKAAAKVCRFCGHKFED